MFKRCWCTMIFHLPGEWARHQEAQARAREMMGLTRMEEVATLELNYAEICTLLESGTVEHGSSLYEKLRAARDAFQRHPKVYGSGLSVKFKEGK